MRVISRWPAVWHGLLGVYLLALAATSLSRVMYQDAPIMLYSAFLVDRLQLVPYRDFFDNQMPGVYAANIAIGRLGQYSELGVRWVDLSALALLLAVTFGKGTFVAVGDRSTLSEGPPPIFTSTNGATWTSRNSSLTIPLTGIAYGNGKFVAVDGRGGFARSTDGLTWTNDAEVFGVPIHPNGPQTLFGGVARCTTTRAIP